MAKTDKDIHQKELALRFCVLSGYLPFLEVNVENLRELSDVSTTITDVDALGILIDASGSRRMTIFDCKTSKSSPINRAFWASGLMSFIESDQAFVILRRKAPEAQRLSAKKLNVHLFDENQFTHYAEAYSLNFKEDYSYCTHIENWLSLSEIYKNYPAFEKFGEFLDSEVPIENDPARGVKRLFAALKKGRGEFNPAKVQHQAIFQHVLMSFCYLLSMIVHDLKSVIDYDSDKETFEKILKYYIWNGRESYLTRQRLKEMFSHNNQSIDSELEFSNWSEFVELVRKLLDAPAEVFKASLFARELSLRTATNQDEEKDKYLAKILSSSSRIRQFLFSQARYLQRAQKLPTEFIDRLNQQFDELA